MEKAVPEVKVRWAFWIPFIVVLGIVTNVMQGIAGIGGYGCIYGLSTVSIPFSMPVLMLLIPLLAYPLSLVRRLKVQQTALGLLCIVGLLTSMTMCQYGGTGGWNSVPWGYVNRVYYSEADIKGLLAPMWYIAPYDAVVRMRVGGSMPDWGAWAGTSIFYILYQSAYFLLGSSLMLLLRRRWIDVERLPFPFPLATWQAVKEAHRIEKPKISTPFLLGAIVGFVINMQILLTYIFPWWPDVIGWRTLGVTGVTPNGCVPVPIGDPIGSVIAGFMRWNIQPLNFAIAFLAPLNVLFGMWVSTFIMMVLAQVAYICGYYTALSTIAGCCRALGNGGYLVTPVWGPPLYWNWMTLTGGMLAFVAMILWQARPYLRETVKAARFGRQSGVDETGEPMSYRSIYIMLAIASIFLLAFLYSVGIGLQVGIVMLVFGGVIYGIAEAYARGAAGVAYGQGRDQWSTWPLRFAFWNVAPEKYTVEYFMGVSIMSDGLDAPAAGETTWTTTTMYTFRLAELAGIAPKTAYKLMAATFIITLLIRVPVSLWWVNLEGQSVAKLCGGGWDCDIAGRPRYSYAPPINQIAIAAIAGFIIVISLFYLHSRFVWWPIHPMGFLLSGGMYIVWTGVWTSFLVAWVLKYLTLRIGGSKAYEQYAVPFVGGTLVGLVLTVLVGVIVGTVRFFIPF